MFSHARYMIGCAAGVLLIGNAWDLSASGQPWWKFVIAMVMIIAGLAVIEANGAYWDQWHDMPHRWDCSIGNCKGKGVGVEASHQSLVDAWRTEHLRTTHLMEP